MSRFTKCHNLRCTLNSQLATYLLQLELSTVASCTSYKLQYDCQTMLAVTQSSEALQSDIATTLTRNSRKLRPSHVILFLSSVSLCWWILSRARVLNISLDMMKRQLQAWRILGGLGSYVYEKLYFTSESREWISHAQCTIGLAAHLQGYSKLLYIRLRTPSYATRWPQSWHSMLVLSLFITSCGQLLLEVFLFQSLSAAAIQPWSYFNAA